MTLRTSPPNQLHLFDPPADAARATRLAVIEQKLAELHTSRIYAAPDTEQEPA